MCGTSLFFQILHYTTRLVYGLTFTLICILHLTFINLHTCELQLHKEDAKGRRPKRLPYLPRWDMHDEGDVACVMFDLVSCRKTYTCAWDDITCAWGGHAAAQGLLRWEGKQGLSHVSLCRAAMKDKQGIRDRSHERQVRIPPNNRASYVYLCVRRY